MSAQTPDLHVPDLESRITPWLEVVERRLLDAVSSSRDLTDELTRHLAVAGGKRMRPLLTLVCAQLGDPERALSDRVITAAAAVELTHLASLYHDDVMDSAPTRRGVPSAQRLWGNNRAILYAPQQTPKSLSLLQSDYPIPKLRYARYSTLCSCL